MWTFQTYSKRSCKYGPTLTRLPQSTWTFLLHGPHSPSRGAILHETSWIGGPFYSYSGWHPMARDRRCALYYVIFLPMICRSSVQPCLQPAISDPFHTDPSHSFSQRYTTHILYVFFYTGLLVYLSLPLP